MSCKTMCFLQKIAFLIFWFGLVFLVFGALQRPGTRMYLVEVAGTGQIVTEFMVCVVLML